MSIQMILTCNDCPPDYEKDPNKHTFSVKSNIGETPDQTYTRLRAESEAAGWMRGFNWLDYCPECWNKGVEKEGR
jgi:hypothetical protein